MNYNYSEKYVSKIWQQVYQNISYFWFRIELKLGYEFNIKFSQSQSCDLLVNEDKLQVRSCTSFLGLQ